MPRQPYPISSPRHYPTAPLVGVGVAVFNAAGEVLLVKRGRQPNLGQWSIPGGALDIGEGLVECGRREVKEECAIEVEIGAEIMPLEFVQWDAEDRVEYHSITVTYGARYISGEAVAQDDAADIGWYRMDQLEELNLRPTIFAVLQKGYQQMIES